MAKAKPLDRSSSPRVPAPVNRRARVDPGRPPPCRARRRGSRRGSHPTGIRPRVAGVDPLRTLRLRSETRYTADAIEAAQRAGPPPEFLSVKYLRRAWGGLRSRFA